ncbi:MAG: aspartyl/glutamyl-tRNA amidotransferase subunit A [Candidatus Diapherotrites archaeon]|nr:aspartyl/glutamyl-tRNA amidotransferase subunit A [Candidatus Diapherotrites archaeon]
MILQLSDFVNQVKAGQISISENTYSIIEEAKKVNKKYNYFTTICEDFALAEAERLEREVRKGFSGLLLGVPVSIKDCICVKGVESKAGSKILEGYKPNFDATVVAKVRAEGAIIIGKTSQDEFGFGTFGKNVGVDFEIPKNPFDESRSCGGSSSGSAGFTAISKHTHVSIAESTGGSIACPSSFCGIVGITPTYGRVSRFGLIDYACSLDKIGSMGKNVNDAFLLQKIISGYDERDSTSIRDQPDISILKRKNYEIAIPKELVESDLADKKVLDIFWNCIHKMESEGFSYKEVSLPLNSKYSIPTYYLIAVSEASTNLAKFCGLRYGKHEVLKGYFDDYFSDVRSNNLGKEAKRRIILGTFARMSGFRDAFYLRAMKARTLLIDEYKRIFSKFDFVVHPTMPILPPKFEDISKFTPVQDYFMDLFTVPANLSGLPHISLNMGFVNNLPCGIMLTADFLRESELISAASFLEGLL